MTLQNSKWINDPVQVQERPVNFWVNQGFHSLSQILQHNQSAVKKLPLFRILVWCQITWNGYWSISPFSVHVCMRPDFFLHVFQPNNTLQQTEYKSKEIYKNKEQCHSFSLNFHSGKMTVSKVMQFVTCIDI